MFSEASSFNYCLNSWLERLNSECNGQCENVCLYICQSCYSSNPTASPTKQVRTSPRASASSGSGVDEMFVGVVVAACIFSVFVVCGTMGYIHVTEKYYQVHIEDDDDLGEQRNFEMPDA